MLTLCGWWLALLLSPVVKARDQIAFKAPHRPNVQTFSLSHGIHLGGHAYPGLHLERQFSGKDRIDVRSSDEAPYDVSNLVLRSTPQLVYKPLIKGGTPAYDRARRALAQARRQGKEHEIEVMGWDIVTVQGPDTSDWETLNSLGKMSSNAYTQPKDTSGWIDPGMHWNLSNSFGWEQDGLRGHVFATPDNATVVVALKGTSAGLVGGGGNTGRNDKLNDNLLFSCCCARVDWSWATVCDCFAGAYKCNQDCVEQALTDKSVYFPLATDLYNNVTKIYPNSQIWLTGHSLGGSLASLLSITFGTPCVTFEAPGDLMAAKRLHLPLPPALPSSPDPSNPSGVATTHVFHTADPIPEGVCTGSLASCALAGFALESKCHTGQQVVYDTVGELGWSVDIRTHSIGQVIDKLLRPDWDIQTEEVHLDSERSFWRSFWPGWGRRGNGSEGDHKQSQGVPKPVTEHDCVDCFKWSFGNGPDFTPKRKPTPAA
ncbi:uncharacterized protein L969DRAFT_17732 [Mixia osmundae IAM 14324]|uniref:triacylglycerol lipase n=1 Tax=Mixia osmundae (strain CBS 9802 / IAM 14324 / JCM 22182 / KY 12970) TaxID=764103 RepID=G7E1X5_MIXOS|nr:uncharacterized protein L969DRAFT_17732 [Mixia osmundae IAM 14324]KEI38655.1 hypothetical protein L969DRAFT_17732 [Mixia osmundae IAM 14324]GAA96888.1 hypothetical protein E5Q_03561 [Mixia osmundae IAM 14324]